MEALVDYAKLVSALLVFMVLFSVTVAGFAIRYNKRLPTPYLLKFTPDHPAPCPKCGMRFIGPEEVSFTGKPYSKVRYCRLVVHPNLGGKFPSGHLHRECPRCGAEWVEATSDAV
jgi:hypothetical protein